MSTNNAKRPEWIVILILILSLLLVACGSKADEPTGNPTYIDTIEVEERGGEYYAQVAGHYPDACSETSDIVQTVEGNTIHLTIYSTRPEGMVCAQMLTPFTEEILLDTEGLDPGEYTIIVNEDNAMTTFTLS